jgi:hypothetical protein
MKLLIQEVVLHVQTGCMVRHLQQVYVPIAINMTPAYVLEQQGLTSFSNTS